MFQLLMTVLAWTARQLADDGNNPQFKDSLRRLRAACEDTKRFL